MGSMLQNPLVLVIVAAVLIFFATSLFGFWELRLPVGLTRAVVQILCGLLRQLIHGPDPGGGGGALHRPLCAGALHLGGQSGFAWLGFLVFFTLSLGLGLPLFLLAMFSGSLEKLPRSGSGCSGCASSWAGSWWAWRPILSGHCCPNP